MTLPMELDEPFVEIHSLRNIQKRLDSLAHPEEYALISYGEDEDQFPLVPPSLATFRLILPDIDYPYIKDMNAFFPEAKELAHFIDTQIQQGKKILCQCEYGVSRSAATAAAILEAYYCEGITIFSSFDYKPNKAIYKKLLQALREIPITPFVVY